MGGCSHGAWHFGKFFLRRRNAFVGQFGGWVMCSRGPLKVPAARLPARFRDSKPQSFSIILGMQAKPLDIVSRTVDIAQGLVGLGRLLLSQMMHRVCGTRGLLAAAMLVAYVAHVMCGQVLHDWECGANCGVRVTAAAGAHCCTDCNLAHPTASESRSTPSWRKEYQHHDSNSCWLCHVLGQPQTEAAGLNWTMSVAMTGAAAVTSVEVPAASHSRGFQSRAPPIG